MRHTQGLMLGSIALTLLATVNIAWVQAPEAFKARLSAVPIDPISATNTRGSGSVAATLSGNVLAISGKFEGLNSPAVAAHVHRGYRGIRGPSVFDLTITKATSGIVEGRMTLTAAQVQELNRGWYYVQIHTQNNPEGHLRGWLLK